MRAKNSCGRRLADALEPQAGQQKFAEMLAFGSDRRGKAALPHVLNEQPRRTPPC